jgi:hypothetical protein
VNNSIASCKRPAVVARLAEWQYLERSLHRVLAAWGRSFAEWDEKVSVCRHVWETAEGVRRIRERAVQFPGTKTNLELPVSRRLENLANTVLLAPGLEDAVDGIYQFLSGTIARAYIAYIDVANPVHDAPTLAAIAENVRAKEQFRLWYQERRRRVPHVTDPEYLAAMSSALEDCDGLRFLLNVDEPAQPVGVRTGFRPIGISPHPPGTRGKVDIMPFLVRDFQRRVETRRLFWCYGCMREMNLAEDQLVWIYDAWHMPWEFMEDVSRHTWDESRHGDSGRSRLLDFGIDLTEIGYGRYVPCTEEEEANGDSSKPMSLRDLYDAMLSIGMVAETGHFPVKHEAYADFSEGGDMESAEMVLFDIIDETTHVQYAHRWLPVMAGRLGIPEQEFKTVGATMRREASQKVERQLRSLADLEDSGAAYEKYEEYLARMRDLKPLANRDTCPPRTMLPMA